MENKTTVDSIFEYFTTMVANKQPIDSITWLDGAERMNVLLQSEQEKLFEMEQKIALMKKILLDDGKTVAYAKTMVDTTDEMKFMKAQKAKIDRCIEMIRLCKIQARMSTDILRSQI